MCQPWPQCADRTVLESDLLPSKSGAGRHVTRRSWSLAPADPRNCATRERSRTWRHDRNGRKGWCQHREQLGSTAARANSHSARASAVLTQRACATRVRLRCRSLPAQPGHNTPPWSLALNLREMRPHRTKRDERAATAPPAEVLLDPGRRNAYLLGMGATASSRTRILPRVGDTHGVKGIPGAAVSVPPSGGRAAWLPVKRSDRPRAR
jgi:hypothetical protein